MAASEQAVRAVESRLVNLSGVSLEALRAMDSRVFTESLERLLDQIDGPQAISLSYNPSRFD